MDDVARIALGIPVAALLPLGFPQMRGKSNSGWAALISVGYAAFTLASFYPDSLSFVLLAVATVAGYTLHHMNAHPADEPTPPSNTRELVPLKLGPTGRRGVRVEDLTGGGDHFRAEVVSGRFDGLSRIEQHQLAYGVFGEEVGGAIHALSITTSTPGES